jgi:hypothetical protein
MDEEVYGSNLSFLEKIKLLTEWAPLIARLQVIFEAREPMERATAIVDALQWAAGKSNTELDDEALFHIEAILKSNEGKAAFDWVVAKVST